MKEKVLVIIPAYNEANSIEDVIYNVKSHLPYADILVLNDGSTDNTSEIARKANAIVIDMPFNMGIGAVVQTGFIYANNKKYDFAIQIDGDGQHDAAEAAKLLKIMKINNYNVVLGSRHFMKNYPSSFLRQFGSKFFSWLLFFLTREKFNDPTSGLRVFNRKAIEFFSNEYPADYPEPEALLFIHKKKLSFAEIPVVMNKRTKGVSSISPIKAIYYMIKVTIAIIIGAFKKIK